MLVRHVIPMFKALADVLQYWEKLLGMIEKGEIDPLKMVSHRVRIEDLDKVYYKFDKKEDGMQKVFVQTRFSAPPCQGSPSLTTY
jgi:threonine dehydrogenase-like Zn-dependent dehydrogenase